MSQQFAFTVMVAVVLTCGAIGAHLGYKYLDHDGPLEGAVLGGLIGTGVGIGFFFIGLILWFFAWLVSA